MQLNCFTVIDILTKVWTISGDEVAVNEGYTLRLKQNVRRFVDIFNLIFFHEHVCILIQISLNMFLVVQLAMALGQIMDWC